MATKKWKRPSQCLYNEEVQWQHWTSFYTSAGFVECLEERHLLEHKHGQCAQDANGEHQHYREQESLLCGQTQKASATDHTPLCHGRRCNRFFIEVIGFFFVERGLGRIT